MVVRVEHVIAAPQQPAAPWRPRRHADLGLSDEKLLEMYETMLLARTLDERQWILNRQGTQLFVISCQGHEAAQVGSVAALERGLDVFGLYYRDLAAALWLGVTPRDVLLESLGRAEGPWTGGRQMPTHYGDRRLKILSSGSCVATQITHATGAAYASKLRGDRAVAVAYFGDGGASEGDFHQGLSFGAIYKLPVIYICENNGRAISTPTSKQSPTASVAERAAAYNLPGVVVDGSDVLAVYEVTRAAAERARRGEGPTLIDARVPRLTPHSSDDDQTRYRDYDELAQARNADPLVRARRYLLQAGLLDEDREVELANRVRGAVEQALEYALTAPVPDPATATKHVFKEGPRA